MIFFFAILALTPAFLLWLSAIGNPFHYLDPAVPEGQLLYVLSKLAGLCAVSLFTVQLIVTVLRGTPFGPSMRGWPTAAHAILGAGVLFAALLHVILFVAAASIRSEHLVTALLLPRWSTGFYDSMTSLGALALYTLVFIAVAGALGRRLGIIRVWSTTPRYLQLKAQRIHRALVFLSVPLIIIHSYAIGSETGTLPFIIFYVVLGIAALIGLLRFVIGNRS